VRRGGIGMRRVGIAIGVMTLLCCALALSSWVWVSRAVANVEPGMMCLSQRHRSQVAGGTISRRQQDIIVTRTMAGRMGAAKSNLSWHLRGALIHWTYVVFWSGEERSGIFDRLAARMEVCPGRMGQAVGARAARMSAH
jgi:hypothetical protein